MAESRTLALQFRAMFTSKVRCRQVLVVAGLLFTVASAGLALSLPVRPNIVVILTDDAGYSDPGCYGGEIPTPNIDALAANGVRFAKFYTNARCSPTRASLLTGMYPHRVGVGELCGRAFETPFPGYKASMDKDALTIAEALREGGYHTMMAGKWHLGGGLKEGKEYRPLARGFDRHFGKLGGESSYFDAENYLLDGALYTRGAEEYGDAFYATRATSDYAVRFMREARAKDRRPFFLYVAYNAPHKPYDVPDADLDKHRYLYRGKDWETIRKARYEGLLRQGLINKRWNYVPMSAKQQKRFNRQGWSRGQMSHVAAMSNVVDEGVGQIVGALRELGELENTLIVYLSDNGPDGFHALIGATPLTGAKRFLTEGGTATHCILHWPMALRKPGRIERRPGHVIDLMPTFLEVARMRLPSNLDGQSLLPVIYDKSFSKDRMLFWELYGQQAAIENGRWKYLLDSKGKARLYDLKSDPSETRDLAADRPRKLLSLTKKYQQWADANNVMPPGAVEKWRKDRLAAEAEKRKAKKKQKHQQQRLKRDLG